MRFKAFIHGSLVSLVLDAVEGIWGGLGKWIAHNGGEPLPAGYTPISLPVLRIRARNDTRPMF